MVDWEKGERYERLKWEHKINNLIIKIENGKKKNYSKYIIVAILKKYLLEEDKEQCQM